MYRPEHPRDLLDRALAAGVHVERLVDAKGPLYTIRADPTPAALLAAEELAAAWDAAGITGWLDWQAWADARLLVASRRLRACLDACRPDDEVLKALEESVHAAYMARAPLALEAALQAREAYVLCTARRQGAL